MANQTYSLIVTGRSSSQFVQNVFHYRMDDDSFPNRLEAAKGLVDGWIANANNDIFLNMLPAAYEMLSVKARRVTEGGGPEYVDVSVASSSGGRTGDAQVSGTGPVILWMTSGGPRRVGKTFLPGISISDVDGGEITAAAKAAILAEADNFRAAFDAVGGATPSCVLVIPRANDPATRSLIVDVQISKDIGTQRRRQLPV